MLRWSVSPCDVLVIGLCSQIRERMLVSMSKLSKMRNQTRSYDFNEDSKRSWSGCNVNAFVIFAPLFYHRFAFFWEFLFFTFCCSHGLWNNTCVGEPRWTCTGKLSRIARPTKFSKLPWKVLYKVLWEVLWKRVIKIAVIFPNVSCDFCSVPHNRLFELWALPSMFALRGVSPKFGKLCQRLRLSLPCDANPLL